MSNYDGREVELHEDVLRLTAEGAPRRIDPLTRQAILLFLLVEEQEEMPPDWFVYWEALQKGLRVCYCLRRAVFDLHIADIKRLMPALPILSLDPNCGVAGMLLTGVNRYRARIGKLREPKTRKEYEIAAANTQGVVSYILDVATIEDYMDTHNVKRDIAISCLVDEAVRTVRTRSSSAEEKARIKALKATPRGRGSKGERGASNRSSSADSNQSDEFVQERGRQARRNEKARLANLPDSVLAEGLPEQPSGGQPVIPRAEEETDEAMDINEANTPAPSSTDTTTPHPGPCGRYDRRRGSSGRRGGCAGIQSSTSQPSP